MNTKKKTIKSIIGCSAACSALLLGGVGAVDMLKPKHEVFAAGVGSIPVSISNSNFNSNTSSNYPFSPNSYSAYNDNKKVTSSSNSEANGVINLSNEKYETRFSLAKRTTLDNYVLMIDSSEETDGVTTYNTVNYGYRTNSEIKLDANSKYMFTVDVFTATNANIASLFLYDNNGDEFSALTGLNSYNQWTTYAFFVSTNNTDSLSVKVGMYLQGAGTVLFDNLSATKLSEEEYNNSKNALTSGSFVEEDKKAEAQNVVATYNIQNNKLVDVDNTSNAFNFDDAEEGGNNQLSLRYVDDNDGLNSKAVLVKSDEATLAHFETKDIFTFKQNRIYRIDVKAKTNNLNGSASLQLIRTDIEKDDENYNAEKHNKSISISSNTVSSSPSVTYDYTTYSFYVQSHTSKDLTYRLKFGLGSSDKLTSGELYISQIQVSNVNYSAYDSASGSNTAKISFVETYSNSNIMLNNGDFNGFKISDHSSPMPATPIDWNVTTGKNKQKYGVVNTQTFATDVTGLSNLTNPSLGANDNVLMMYNETADTLSYTSATKTISANSYHKFMVDVQTQNAPLTISLVTKKDQNEIVLASKTINTNYAWQRDITLFIHGGHEDLDVSLKLTLSTEGYGYAYIDNAKFDWTATETQIEQEFKSAMPSSTVAVADLDNILSSDSNEKYANLQFFTQPNMEGVESGTVELNAAYLDEVIYDEENLESFNSIASKGLNKVLAIWSTQDVNYSLTSNIGFKLTSDAGKFYKISVDVYTQGLTSTTANADQIGAGIKLTGLDNSFTAIKSNNEWTTYTFYIQGSSLTTYLELSLGSEESKTNGAAFFGNVVFDDSVSESEYNSAVETENVKVVKAETTNTETETTPDNDKTSNKISKTTWIYLIPSLLTGLAIIIAIVGFAVRKIKWKKPTKKSKTAYDRNKTVSVQYYTRKATTLREEKVRELTADLAKINAERKQYEDDYKQGLTKLREMKIKRANPAEIAKFEKDLKKNQKMSSSLGVTANRISTELEYAKTDAYLNSLVKKLSREPVTTNTQEDENK